MGKECLCYKQDVTMHWETQLCGTSLLALWPWSRGDNLMLSTESKTLEPHFTCKPCNIFSERGEVLRGWVWFFKPLCTQVRGTGQVRWGFVVLPAPCVLNCCFCLCRLGASSLDALRLEILVGCWTTSWLPNSTAQAVWPMSRVLEACLTNSTISSRGPQTVSTRVWPSVGTGNIWESSTVTVAGWATCLSTGP